MCEFSSEIRVCVRPCSNVCEEQELRGLRHANLTNIRDDKCSEVDTIACNSAIRALMEPHGDVMRRAAQLSETACEEVQMEGRIARLESDVAHVQKDVAEIKADVKNLRDKVDGVRDKVEAGFTDIRQSIAQLTVAMERAYGKARVATIETRVWGLTTLGGILFLIARAFKWI
jgi:uncharacterized coiled-coil protein SlyX